MKRSFREKTLALLMVLCFTLSCFPFSASAQNTSAPSGEELALSPSEASVASAATEGPTLDNASYYINNKGSGDYLQFNATASQALPASGLLSTLGNGIRWQVVNVTGGVLLKPSQNTDWCLGVSPYTSSTDVQMLYLGNSTATPQYMWTMEAAAGNSGILFRSVYNGRYLYVSGTSLKTDASLGVAYSDGYKSHVWRCVKTNEYGNTASFSNRELDMNTAFSTVFVTLGTDSSPSYTKSPSNALWADLEDFDLDVLVSNHLVVGSHYFYGTDEGVTTVIATHKVTDQKFAFAVIVGEQPTLHVQNYTDEGFELRFRIDEYVADQNGKALVSEYNDVVAELYETLFGLDMTHSVESYTSLPDECKKMMYDPMTFACLSDACYHDEWLNGEFVYPHGTRTCVLEGVGWGTDTVTKVAWTGHRLTSSGLTSVAFLPPGNSIVITPYDIPVSLPHILMHSHSVRQKLLEALSHELGHLLGTVDHYCTNNRQNDISRPVCSNPHCDICDGGYTTIRYCIMGINTIDIETVSEYAIYCQDCLTNINTHLTSHHQ